MATFEYNALTSAGRLMKGTIEAGTNQEAGELLKQMQLVVNSVEKARLKKPKTAIGRNEFVLFNQQLASITKAGIPLERGLRELAGDISSRSMRRLVDAVADELEAGVSIEQAFEKRQKHFPPLYGRILKAGVETGRLSEMLTSLNRHLEMANQTRRIIFEAMCYPAVILALAAVILTGVFMFIIPQFGSVLEEMTDGGSLPAITRLFLSMSKNVVPFWITVGFVIAAIVALFAMLSTSAAGRRFKESLLLRIPVIGRVYHSSMLSRMAEGMAIMVAAGSDMPVSLRLSSGATGSEKLILESEALAAQIEQGANILEAGQLCRVIPRLFLYSIQLGTQRNELQDNLYSLGQMYAEQARCGQARLQAVLLPVMLIGVGCFLAMTILAMFLPMISIITSLSSS
ncbi:MAG TPA: type II secretion system F family protein [Sedimentisphaerales bacterium]|nr:type II secretion system F family protein [Sedimentisphaerales bacterium]